MGPKKDTASTSKASKAPDKKKDRKFDSCVMYFPRKKQRDDSGLFMFDLMHWIEITKHPSFPTPPGRILRDRKLEDHDRLCEYTIPYFLGKRRIDMKAHIFAVVEKGTRKIIVNAEFVIIGNVFRKYSHCKWHRPTRKLALLGCRRGRTLNNLVDNPYNREHRHLRHLKCSSLHLTGLNYHQDHQYSPTELSQDQDLEVTLLHVQCNQECTQVCK